MPKEVTIDINDQGEVQIEAKGVKGRSCLDLTREIESALGPVSGRESKPEMHQQETLGAGRTANHRAG